MLVKSAGRVLDVLETLAASPTPLGVVEIARRLGMPKSSASMLLSTLEARSYVVADQGRRFCLHPMFRAHAGSWVGGSHSLVLRIARPAMTALVQRTGESSFLGILTPDWQLQYIDKVVSPHEVRFDADIVSPRPLHCTSVGLVLLAFQANEDIETFLAGPLSRRTSKTIIDPQRLRATLKTVRAKGVAVSVDANLVGASGFAAPIFGPGRRILAGINISAPTTRFHKVREMLREELLKAAHEINLLTLPPEARTDDNPVTPQDRD